MLKTLRVMLAAVLTPPMPGGIASRAPVTSATDPAPLIAPAVPPSTIPTLPRTAIPSVSEAALPAGSAAANPGRTALERLQANIPFKEPSTGDPDKQKSFADRAFDFKLGATSHDSGPAPIPSSPPDRRQAADDGGGPNYPSRMIQALATTFRAVLFRPNVPIEAEIVRAIDATQKGDVIRIAVYEFANKDTLTTLRKARQRGVDIKLIIDYSNMFPRPRQGDDDYAPKRSREIWTLMREGFDVKVLKGLGKFGINHNKIAVIESARGSLAIFGSYNWKWTAEQAHYENANFTDERRRVDALKAYWSWLDTLAVRAVYDDSNGSVKLEDPAHQWPKTVPPPPQFARSVHFNGIDLPFLVASPASPESANAEDELVRAFDAAERSIDVSIFALRSTKLVEALLRAQARGLAVRVIVDRGQSTSEAFGPYAQWLAFNAIKVRTLAGPDPSAPFQLAQKDHHKFSIIDDTLVEVGSPNYTKYAFIGNYENAHFIDDPTDLQSYRFVFERMWARAEPFSAPAAAPALPSDAALIQEVFPDAPTPDDPTPPTPSQPEPAWPKPAARDILFNEQTVPSVALTPDTPVAPMIERLIKSARKSVRLSGYELNLPQILDAARWLRANKPKVKIEFLIDRSHVYTTGLDHTGQPRKPSPQIVALIKEGFDVLLLNGSRGGIMHSKYFVIDAPETGLGARAVFAAINATAQVAQALASQTSFPRIARWSSNLAVKAHASQERVKKQTGLVLRGSYNFANTAENNHYENVVISIEKERVQNYLNNFKYMRALGEKVDLAKLDEVLSRTELPKRRPRVKETGAEVEPETFMELAPTGPQPEPEPQPELGFALKVPPPPSNPETPHDLNGEKFQGEYFSPNGGVLDAWLRAIDAATSSIDVAMFGFYSRELAEKIVSALQEKQKLVADFRLRLVLDAGQASLAKFDKTPGDPRSGIRVSDWLDQRGVDVNTNDGPHGRDSEDPRDPMFEKMHSKYLIADNKFVLTGSWNASDRAERDNFENATVLTNPTDVSVFVWDFERLRLRSIPVGKKDTFKRAPSPFPGL